MAVSVRHPLGREDELAALLDRLGAPAESFGVAVIWGEAGIGKTSLSNAVTDAAAELGYLVLSCRPSEVEAGFSFVGLADLLGDVVDDVLPDLPRPQRRALEAALGRSEIEGERADEGLVAFAFLTVLRTLAQRQPIVARDRRCPVARRAVAVDAPLRPASARRGAGCRAPRRPRRGASVAPPSDPARAALDGRARPTQPGRSPRAPPDPHRNRVSSPNPPAHR